MLILDTPWVSLPRYYFLQKVFDPFFTLSKTYATSFSMNKTVWTCKNCLFHQGLQRALRVDGWALSHRATPKLPVEGLSSSSSILRHPFQAKLDSTPSQAYLGSADSCSNSILLEVTSNIWVHRSMGTIVLNSLRSLAVPGYSGVW